MKRRKFFKHSTSWCIVIMKFFGIDWHFSANKNLLSAVVVLIIEWTIYWHLSQSEGCTRLGTRQTKTTISRKLGTRSTLKNFHIALRVISIWIVIIHEKHFSHIFYTTKLLFLFLIYFCMHKKMRQWKVIPIRVKLSQLDK